MDFELIDYQTLLRQVKKLSDPTPGYFRNLADRYFLEIGNDMSKDFTTQTISELLETYRDVIDELRRRQVVRTDNAPTGDYAEYLVARLYDGELAPNSEKSFDVAAASGERLQVKARVAVEGRPGTRQLSVIRSWEFDSLIIVLFTPRYGIQRAAAAPTAIAKARSRFVRQVNGHRITANDALLNATRVDDITEPMRRARL